MSLKLQTSGGTPLVRATLAAVLTAVLMAVMLALLPSMAEARTEGESTPSVVVQPGDSLWSISEGRLGPNATPQRVANAAERIHALNRGRIGTDPNLIFVSQELSLPPALSERPTGVSATPKTGEAADTGERARAAKGTTGTMGKASKPVPRTVTGGAEAEGAEAPETAARHKARQKAEPVGLPALPDEAAAAPVPAVRAVASDGSPTSPVASSLRTIRAELAYVPTALTETFADADTEGRRLLGLGVILLTLLVAALIAWKLPMRRTTREEAERWGISTGYYRGTPAAHRIATFAPLPGSPGDLDREEAGQEETPVTLAPEQRGVPTGNGFTPVANGARNAVATTSAIASVVAARRVRRAKPKPRNGLALGAHNPEVRRAPRRARATMRARRLRPRLRQGRGVSARVGR